MFDKKCKSLQLATVLVCVSNAYTDLNIEPELGVAVQYESEKTSLLTHPELSIQYSHPFLTYEGSAQLELVAEKGKQGVEYWQSQNLLSFFGDSPSLSAQLLQSKRNTNFLETDSTQSTNVISASSQLRLPIVGRVSQLIGGSVESLAVSDIDVESREALTYRANYSINTRFSPRHTQGLQVNGEISDGGFRSTTLSTTSESNITPGLLSTEFGYTFTDNSETKFSAFSGSIRLDHLTQDTQSNISISREHTDSVTALSLLGSEISVNQDSIVELTILDIGYRRVGLTENVDLFFGSGYRHTNSYSQLAEQRQSETNEILNASLVLNYAPTPKDSIDFSATRLWSELGITNEFFIQYSKRLDRLLSLSARLDLESTSSYDEYTWLLSGTFTP